MGYFLHQLDPDIRKIRLERLHLKDPKKKILHSLQQNMLEYTHTHTHFFDYITLCVNKTL